MGDGGQPRAGAKPAAFMRNLNNRLKYLLVQICKFVNLRGSS
jgi:hypothetical protein